MEIYVFDKRWRKTGDGTKKRKASYTAGAHAKGVKTDEFTVDKEHTIATISVFIIKHAKTEKISLLRLCSHGNAGRMSLGTGLDEASQTELLKLKTKGVFEKGAVVELHGCGVASASPLVKDPDGHNVGYWKKDGKGHRFLKALASTLGVPVRGGVEGQLSDTAWKYEYQYVTVQPNGDFTLSGVHSKG